MSDLLSIEESRRGLRADLYDALLEEVEQDHRSEGYGCDPTIALAIFDKRCQAAGLGTWANDYKDATYIPEAL